MSSIDPAFESDLARSQTTLTFQGEVRKTLSQVGLYDFLIINHQPCLVLHISRSSFQIRSQIAYCNPALLQQVQLCKDLRGELHRDAVAFSQTQAGFYGWVLAQKSDAVASRSYSFKNYLWSNCCTIENRYMVLFGSLHDPGKETVSDDDQTSALPLQTASDDQQHVLSSVATDVAPRSLVDEHQLGLSSTFDLTRGQYKADSLSVHQRYVLDFDWSQTALGPMKTWSPALRTAFNLCLTDPDASCLFWGEDRVLVYNESYPPLIQGSHPCVGQKALEALPRYAETISSITQRIRADGQPVYFEDLPIPYSQDGNEFTEGYFSIKTVPLLDIEGQVAGMYQLITESTNRVLLQRRIDTFNVIGARMLKAKTLPELWHAVIDSMATNEEDIPFAVLYASSDNVVNCEGFINVPEGHVAATKSFNLEGDSRIGFAPMFRESMKWDKPLLLHVIDGTLPKALVEGIESRAFGEAIRAVVVLPIYNGARVLGFLVVGCNPRRPFDDSYSAFLTQLSRTIAAGVASTVLLDDATHIQAALSDQLTDHQRRLQQQGQRFKALAERVGVAIFVTDVEGQYSFRNNTWFSLFPAAANDLRYQTTWTEALDPESEKLADDFWQQLFAGREQLRVEFKLKRKWNDPQDLLDSNQEGVPHTTWLLASAFPSLRDDGSVEEIICTLTDISHQKWSERIQQMHKDSALESRHQLEQFIDTTSHEIRNPLTAITHCANELVLIATTTLNGGTDSVLSNLENRQVMTEIQETSEIIVSCSSHMKRIVDDVLTMSKLNGNLLIVSPSPVQPEFEIANTLRLFRAEAIEAGVDLQPLNISQRYRDLNVDSVEMDYVRISQIMVNLISNAIKFTRLENIRQVSVTLDASVKQPLDNLQDCHFLEMVQSTENNSFGSSWAAKDCLFIIVSVKDTGKGLTDDEAHNLFSRFSQGSPRTYVQYGGNGLGLYISQKIVGLHRGAIGFRSVPGQGSTFAFYFMVRRAMVMPSTDEIRNGDIARSIDKTSGSLVSAAKSLRISASSSGIPSSLDWKQLHILVVEDNLLNQKVLVKQLRRLGARVEASNDGLECLQHIETTKHWVTTGDAGVDLSVILLDWEMPNCNGLECTKRIRELQKQNKITSHIPIIGVTANARPEQIDQALAAGMDTIVCKPFTMTDLQSKLDVLLKSDDV